MAAASRRASFWLSLATDLDLLRLPGQIGGGDLIPLQSERRLVGHHGQNHRAGRADAPGSDPPQRAAVEFVLLGQQVAQHATGVIRLEAREMVWFLGQAPLALLKAPPNHRANINRKSAGHLNPDVFGAANRFHLRGKTIKDGRRHLRCPQRNGKGME